MTRRLPHFYCHSGDLAQQLPPSLPTQLTVLKTMYDEFRHTGDIEEVPFEEFVQFTNPNVVILSPAELESFAKQKEEC